MERPRSRRAAYEGRASRGQFWRVMAGVWGIGLGYLVFDNLVLTDFGEGLRDLLLIGLALMLLVPTLAITIRRLHDLDYAGWFALFAFIPYLGLAFLVVLGCLPGSAGPNRFGEDPRPTSAPTPVADPARPREPAPRVARDVITELERLAQLKASGAVTAAEFEVMKAQALRAGQVG